MVKEGWKEVKLDVLYEFRSGLSKGKKFFGSGYPFLTYKEIFNNYFVPQKLNNLAQTSEKERINCSIKRGDVFLTRTSETVEEIGTSCVALKDYPNATFNGFAKRLRPKNNEIYPEYAVCYFRSEKFRNKAASMCSLITRASLNNDDLSHLTISYPKYDIQKKIATILLNYDLLIINIFNRIKILEKIAKLIYDEWFVKIKFPGHEKVKFADSELGKIPEGWEVMKLQDCIELAYGKALKQSDREEGDFLVYGSSGVVGKHNEFLVEGPGIIVGRKGNVGSVFWTFHDFYPIDTVYYVKSEISLYYVYYNFLNQHFLNNDAAVPGLSRKQAYLLPFLKPYDITLALFEKQIEPIFKEIERLNGKKNILAKTRDFLLPKLISGQVDVSGLDIKVPEMQEIVV